MAGPRERAVEQAGDRELHARGAWWINTHGDAYGRAGVPDRIGVYRGVGFAIEYKRPTGGRLSKRQEFELARFARAGGRIAVATSRQDVRNLLDRIDTELRPRRAA